MGTQKEELSYDISMVMSRGHPVSHTSVTCCNFNPLAEGARLNSSLNFYSLVFLEIVVGFEMKMNALEMLGRIDNAICIPKIDPIRNEGTIFFCIFFNIVFRYEIKIIN